MSTEIIDFKQYLDIHRIPDFKIGYLHHKLSILSIHWDTKQISVLHKCSIFQLFMNPL